MNCQHCEIETRLTRMETKLDDLLKQLLDNGQPGALTRHDNRLTALENWRSYVLGALAIIMFLLTLDGGLLLLGKLKEAPRQANPITSSTPQKRYGSPAIGGAILLGGTDR